MSILITIFYSFTWVVLIYEFQSLLYPQRIISVFDRLKSYTDSISLKEQKFNVNYFTGYEKIIMTIYFFYSIWGVIGLFSGQNILFLGLFLIGYVAKAIMGKNNKSALSQRIDAVLSIAFIVTIYANHYFHIFNASFSGVLRLVGII